MAIIAYVCCIFLMAFTLHAVNANYCRQRDCGRTHTMCLFPYSSPARECRKVQFIGLTPYEINTILRLHNKYRHTVASGREYRGSPGPQPPARNLGPLRWDNELALIAQRWVNQCQFRHDQCRHVDRFNVGQNLAILGTTGDKRGLKVEEMVAGWYEEVRFFDRNQVNAVWRFIGPNGQGLHHYIQLVWAKTTHVGCGEIRYNDGYMNTLLLACNYGPMGNLRGEPLYERF